MPGGACIVATPQRVLVEKSVIYTQEQSQPRHSLVRNHGKLADIDGPWIGISLIDQEPGLAAIETAPQRTARGPENGRIVFETRGKKEVAAGLDLASRQDGLR
jgi:hypothetical protein